MRRTLFSFFCLILCYGTFSSSSSKREFTKSELCFMPVRELLQLYSALDVSPVDVLKAQIERIEEFNPQVKAISAKHYAEAFAQARESEKRYREGNPRPLEGITCAIKEDAFTKNWESTKGTLVPDHICIDKDIPFVASLRDAGVVMHVQTIVPEYFCNLVTWNKLQGVCRNPWNLEYTPGGSSGGSAAALAAGFTTLATGSDMGGSIRVPAAMTGLYGFKPPYGRVATCQEQFVSYGPLARTFDDLVVFQNVITGPCEGMMSTIKPKLEYPQDYESIRGWKIAYDPMDNWGIPIDKTVKEAMEKTVEILRSMGAEVVEVDLGFRASDFDTYALGIFSTSMGAYTFRYTEHYPELITPYIAQFIKKYASKTSPQCLLDMEDYISEHHLKVQQLVFSKEFNAIIMPTLCTPYIAADMGRTLDNMNVKINGQSYSGVTWDYAFTWIWNMLGHYPVMNVPIGSTEEGIPMGMQVIADTLDDLTAFQFASQWSKKNK